MRELGLEVGFWDTL